MKLPPAANATPYLVRRCFLKPNLDMASPRPQVLVRMERKAIQEFRFPVDSASLPRLGSLA